MTRLVRLLREYRSRLGARVQASRDSARRSAEQRDLQRKQMVMTQLNGILQNSRRDPGKSR